MILEYRGCVNSLLLLSDPFRGRVIVIGLAMRVKEVIIAGQVPQIGY